VQLIVLIFSICRDDLQDPLVLLILLISLYYYYHNIILYSVFCSSVTIVMYIFDINNYNSKNRTKECDVMYNYSKHVASLLRQFFHWKQISHTSQAVAHLSDTGHVVMTLHQLPPVKQTLHLPQTGPHS